MMRLLLSLLLLLSFLQMNAQNWEPLCRVMPQYEGSAMAPDLLKYKDSDYLWKNLTNEGK